MNTPHKTDASQTGGHTAEYERLNALPLWRTMPSVTLDEMKGIRLMNRIDTKYVLPQRLLAPLLEQAAINGYRIQQIDGARACRYDTLYYDTPSREMYRLHHDRRLVRQKIRTRTYVESGFTFLEIKNKTNKGRTRKKRVAMSREAFGRFTDDAAADLFCRERCAYRPEDLSPSLSTRFLRMTLVDAGMSERVTVDTDLRFENPRSGRCASIEGMAIVELKQDATKCSVIGGIMSRMGIKPLSVSKYCIGTVLTDPSVKANRFKPKLRRIDKILHACAYEDTGNNIK